MDLSDRNPYCLSLKKLLLLSWSTIFLLIVGSIFFLITLRSVTVLYWDGDADSHTFLKIEHTLDKFHRLEMDFSFKQRLNILLLKFLSATIRSLLIVRSHALFTCGTLFRLPTRLSSTMFKNVNIMSILIMCLLGSCSFIFLSVAFALCNSLQPGGFYYLLLSFRIFIALYDIYYIRILFSA